MERDLEKQGVIFYDSDVGLDINEEYLVLPREITEIPSRDLGEYLNAFTQQRVYLRTILGRAEIIEEEARRNYFEMANEAYRELAQQRLSETAKDRIINSDPDVLPLYNEYMDAKKKVQLVTYALNNMDDICFLVSREVTRRSGDFDSERRADNAKFRR